MMMMGVLWYIVYAVGAVLLFAAVAGTFWWFSRPHLEGPTNGEFNERFEKEREKVR